MHSLGNSTLQRRWRKRPAFSKGFFLILLWLTAGCSSGDDPETPSSVQPQSCAQLAVPNEWVVKYRREPRPRLVTALSKKDVETGVGHGRLEWIEANYTFSRPPVAKVITSRPARELGEISFQKKYLKRIGADYAWSHGYYGDGVVVAVVDSGVDIRQPRLEHALFVNPVDVTNGLDDDINGFTDDVYGWNFTNNSPQIIDETGHGTHIAGIIAADHTSNVSRGIAPGARILPVDFVKGEKGDEFSALQAVQYAIDRKAQIINNSWSAVCSQFLRQAFEKWQSENVIFVSSAGNDSESLLDYPLSPADLDLANHVTVGAFGTDFQKTVFSNTGPSVIVLAPGENILSIASGGDQLISRSGTSMAAAFVSGAMAIAWSLHPELAAHDIVKVFKDVHKNKEAGKNPRPLDIRTFLKELDRRFPPSP
jgi:subtilisin family serine protease